MAFGWSLWQRKDCDGYRSLPSTNTTMSIANSDYGMTSSIFNHVDREIFLVSLNKSMATQTRQPRLSGSIKVTDHRAATVKHPAAVVVQPIYHDRRNRSLLNAARSMARAMRHRIVPVGDSAMSPLYFVSTQMF